MARKPRYIWQPDEIKALRKHLGMTQGELGEKIGTNNVVVCNWETGGYRPAGIASAALLKIAEESNFIYEKDFALL